MIIGTFNIRGSDNSTKKRRICQIVRKGKPYVMFFQETKVAKIEK